MEETKVHNQEGEVKGNDVKKSEASSRPAPRQDRGRSKGRQGGGRDKRDRAPREKPEFETKTISIRRVTRVVAGGRRFSLSVMVASGDRKGRIGIGTGKALDTQVAIEKAGKAARKAMIHLKLTKKHSIPHDVLAKSSSGKVMIMPNNGKGLIAGSSARTILALAGVSDVTAKFSSGTKNKINNARATMEALKHVAYRKGAEPVAQAAIPASSQPEETTPATA